MITVYSMKADRSATPQGQTNNSPLWPAFSRINHPAYPAGEITIVKGNGAYLYDSTGKRYFDGFSTLWTNLVGHGREEIISAMTEQMRTLSFMHLFSGHKHEPALKLSHELVSRSPFGHSRCFFGLSGSDAVETAMKMVRAYWFSKKRTDKKTIVGRMSEYHGTSLGALSLMGWDSYQMPYEPLVPQTYRLHPPNCYRCPWGKERATCGISCKESFREYFAQVDAKRTVAAILIEPVITSDGLITPPEGYWEEIQQACREFDVLVIADEVSTGMGRTGALYGSTHFGLKPDIVCLAKSLTSGYAPLSAVLSSEEVFTTLHADGSFFAHGTTFGGHPVSCVAALKTLEVLFREKLIERAQALEPLLREELGKQLSDLEIVGNIRGIGTLFEVELVSDRTRKTPPFDEPGLAVRVFGECMKQGQYVRCLGRYICVAPPLIASDEEIRELAAGLRRALLQVIASGGL